MRYSGKFASWSGAAVLACGLACTAQAADLPMEPMPAVPAPMVAPFSWTGFYLGVHGGGAWADFDMNDIDDGDADESASFEDDSFLFGAQVGANWQAGMFVLGAEADISWVDLSVSDYADPIDIEEIEADYLATFRARAGVAFDRVLIYATGGGALTSIDAYDDDTGTSQDETVWGWTIGAGAEWAFRDNITLRAEYLYVDFEDQDFNFGPAFGEIEASDVDLDVHIARIGINVLF